MLVSNRYSYLRVVVRLDLAIVLNLELICTYVVPSNAMVR